MSHRPIARRLVLAVGLAHWIYNPEVPRDTWHDLVGTGRLELIENSELRRTTSEFYRRVDLQAGFHAEWLDYVRPYRVAVSEIGQVG